MLGLTCSPIGILFCRHVPPLLLAHHPPHPYPALLVEHVGQPYPACTVVLMRWGSTAVLSFMLLRVSGRGLTTRPAVTKLSSASESRHHGFPFFSDQTATGCHQTGRTDLMQPMRRTSACWGFHAHHSAFFLSTRTMHLGGALITLTRHSWRDTSASLTPFACTTVLMRWAPALALIGYGPHRS